MGNQSNLVEKDVSIVEVHDAIFEHALPSVLSPCHLHRYEERKNGRMTREREREIDYSN